jgi:hypothetical protein
MGRKPTSFGTKGPRLAAAGRCARGGRGAGPRTALDTARPDGEREIR